MVRATQQSACQARVGMELAARSLCKSLIIKHLCGAPPYPPRKSLIIKHLRGAPPTPTQVVDIQGVTW